MAEKWEMAIFGPIFPFFGPFFPLFPCGAKIQTFPELFRFVALFLRVSRPTYDRDQRWPDKEPPRKIPEKVTPRQKFCKPEKKPPKQDTPKTTPENTEKLSKTGIFGMSGHSGVFFWHFRGISGAFVWGPEFGPRFSFLVCRPNRGRGLLNLDSDCSKFRQEKGTQT